MGGMGMGVLGGRWGAVRFCSPPESPPPPHSRAFQEYYQEHLEYACPTEDIYLE